MTKDELRKALEEGKQLDELFEFTDGQECQIFKAKCVAHFAGNHEIVYIPDTDSAPWEDMKCLDTTRRQKPCGPL